MIASAVSRTTVQPRRARTIWALLHGLAVLVGQGGFGELGIDEPRERLVAESMAAFLRVRPEV
ncbi:hypothetical protein [Planomonospora sphaerica]|uniref:hypothetical protein n=1 Tax=Planomonospora sphaerica TaxID=161355 RepID=UPI0018D0145E|nr:hypothetical protein [Planomonospora sphaerica]